LVAVVVVEMELKRFSTLCISSLPLLYRIQKVWERWGDKFLVKAFHPEEIAKFKTVYAASERNDRNRAFEFLASRS